MMSIRRAVPIAAAFTFALASCGGSSDGDSGEASATDAPAEVEDAEETEDLTPVESDPVESDAVESDAVETADTEAPADPESVETEEPAPEDTTADTVATSDTVAAEEDTGDAVSDEAAAGATVDLELLEWSIEAPEEYTSGEITFNASNGGSFPHELVVIEGEGYESLPLTEGGAVIEEDLPTGALIGQTGNIGGGASEALTVTLAPGNYVLVCNLGGDSSSHAGRGQRLDITVS